MSIGTALATLFEGQDLDFAQTQAAFSEVMAGDATPAQIGALLAALRVKGETPEEMAGAAAAMRAVSLKVEVTADNLVDTFINRYPDERIAGIGAVAWYITLVTNTDVYAEAPTSWAAIS